MHFCSQSPSDANAPSHWSCEVTCCPGESASTSVVMVMFRLCSFLRMMETQLMIKLILSCSNQDVTLAHTPGVIGVFGRLIVGVLLGAFGRGVGGDGLVDRGVLSGGHGAVVGVRRLWRLRFCCSNCEDWVHQAEGQGSGVVTL